MSVYTEVSQPQLESFLARFNVGQLVSFKGIESGVENTNYFVTTTASEYVLTLFEQLSASELDTLINLAYHLGQQQLNVPAPITANDGSLLQTFYDKPAVLCPRLAGKHIDVPQPEHCFAIGRSLAQLHLAGQSFKQQVTDPFHLDWWQQEGNKLVAHLSEEDQELFHSELEYQLQAKEQWQALPQGWIHADLFHDNALWDGQQFAVLDLYAACHGAYIYDLAILANDWCCDANGQWREGTVEALFEGYNSLRPLSEEEQQAWDLSLRAGALRWWLGRLDTQLFQASFEGGLALHKDPNEYKNKLIARRSLY